MLAKLNGVRGAEDRLERVSTELWEIRINMSPVLSACVESKPHGLSPRHSAATEYQKWQGKSPSDARTGPSSRGCLSKTSGSIAPARKTTARSGVEVLEPGERVDASADAPGMTSTEASPALGINLCTRVLRCDFGVSSSTRLTGRRRAPPERRATPRDSGPN